MKALTLHQPWATLVAHGVKTIETRSWSTKHRGPLAIHSSRSSVTVGVSGLWAELNGEPAPIGCVLATCTLVDVLPIHEQGCKCQFGDGLYVLRATGAFGEIAGLFESPSGKGAKHPKWGPSHLDCLNEQHPRQQRPYGDYRCGRFAWLLGGVHKIEPVEARGRQQLWEWTQ